MTASFRERVRLAELERVFPLLPPGASILEVGAGSGWQARALADRGHQVTAVDVAASDYLAETSYPVQLYDGRTLPFADATFDVVFSSNVLEHVPDVVAFDRELLRVVRPGGLAIHVLPTATWRLWTFATHYAYASKVLWRLVRGAAPGAGDDMFLDRNLAAIRESSPSARLRRAMGRLVAGRHGEVGTALGELVLFSRMRWLRVFRRTGWRLRRLTGNQLLYTGYFVAGGSLSLDARRRLSRVLGHSCLIYVLERPGDVASS